MELFEIISVFESVGGLMQQLVDAKRILEQLLSEERNAKLNVERLAKEVQKQRLEVLRLMHQEFRVPGLN